MRQRSALHSPPSLSYCRTSIFGKVRTSERTTDATGVNAPAELSLNQEATPIFTSSVVVTVTPSSTPSSIALTVTASVCGPPPAASTYGLRSATPTLHATTLALAYCKRSNTSDGSPKDREGKSDRSDR
jgi:hypothetical protein